MNNYIFAASDVPFSEASVSFDALTKSCNELFSVALESDEELKILLTLLGLSEWKQVDLPSEDFCVAFDCSNQRLPQLSKENFEAFYQEWRLKSRRETSMDEYGQLIFLQGRASAWNQKQHWFVLCERP